MKKRTEPIEEGQGHPLRNLSPHHHALICWRNKGEGEERDHPLGT